MSFIKEKMENFRNIEKKYNKYLKQEREKNQYDPRKDLTEDSELWQLVLKETEKKSKQLYSNLHGFRCVGCRLQLDNNNLRMVPGEAIGQHWKDKKDWEKFRKEYLLPYKDTIREIFKTVTNKLSLER